MGMMQLEVASHVHDEAPHLVELEAGPSKYAIAHASPMPNPLASTTFSRKALFKLIAVALLGSTGVTLYLAYILPADIGEIWHGALFVAMGIAVSAIVSLFKGFM